MKKNFVFRIWVVMMAAAVMAVNGGVWGSGSVATASGENMTEDILDEMPSGSANEYEGIIRFHVIANSDSEEDQELKMLVKNSVFVKLQNALADSQTIGDSRRYIEENLEEINGWAESCIDTWGYDYEVDTQLGVTAIPAKQYDDMYFPAGNYEALTVTIGEGRGQNWWCVIFPPLCLVDCRQEPYSEYFEEGEEGRIVLKSKLLEILNR